MKIVSISRVLIFLLVSQWAISQSVEEFFSQSDAFFKQYVKDGLVDYKSLKENPAQLKDLLELAKDLEVKEATPNQYQAFWINGYNLHVIDGIVANYPVKSPLDIAGFFDKTTREIGGKEITLNDIENKLLRGKFPKEARFHFVLVCAGLGCPPIINQAYLPDSLETQLQTQTTVALNNPSFIRMKGKRVLLSQIFEWYKVDFTQDGTSEIDFLNEFRKEQLPSTTKIGYYPYDWTLNESK